MCHRVNKTFQKFPKSESSNSHHLSTSSSLWRSRPQTWAQLLRCIFPPWQPSQRVLDPNSSFPKLHSSCSSLTRLSSNSNLHWAPPPPYDEAAATSSSCSFSACTTPFIVLAPLEHLLLLPLTTDGRLCSRHLLLHLASHQFATSSSLQEPAFQCGATYHQLPYLHSSISQMVSLQLQLLHSSHWLLPKLATWTREENSFILCGNYHSFPVTSIQKH